jgi:hypothetical protein
VSAEFLWKIILGSERLLLACCEFSPLSVGFVVLLFIISKDKCKIFTYLRNRMQTIKIVYMMVDLQNTLIACCPIYTVFK